MTTRFRRVALMLLLASAIGITVSGCLLVPFPVGGGPATVTATATSIAAAGKWTAAAAGAPRGPGAPSAGDDA